MNILDNFHACSFGVIQHLGAGTFVLQVRGETESAFLHLAGAVPDVLVVQIDDTGEEGFLGQTGARTVLGPFM